MTVSLSRAEVERYRTDGYLAPVSVLSPAEAAHYRARLETAEAVAGGQLDPAHRHKPHLVYTWASELIRHANILDAVEAVIGPDILVWESVFFIKEAHSTSFISWHQDITYWGLEHEGDVVTAWLALSPSTAESGCMSVVPGTHRREVVPHRDTCDQDNMLSRGQEIAVEVEQGQSVDLELQPGQMSLHHVKIFHGSHANRSGDRRIGFAIRYLPPHVRQTVGGRDSATLVRGRDRYGGFDLEPEPAADLESAAVARHLEWRRRRMNILMRDMEKTASGPSDQAG